MFRQYRLAGLRTIIYTVAEFITNAIDSILQDLKRRATSYRYLIMGHQNDTPDPVPTGNSETTHKGNGIIVVDDGSNPTSNRTRPSSVVFAIFTGLGNG